MIAYTEKGNAKRKQDLVGKDLKPRFRYKGELGSLSYPSGDVK